MLHRLFTHPISEVTAKTILAGTSLNITWRMICLGAEILLDPANIKQAVEAMKFFSENEYLCTLQAAAFAITIYNEMTKDNGNIHFETIPVMRPH